MMNKAILIALLSLGIMGGEKSILHITNLLCKA